MSNQLPASGARAVRGLATVALLKANFDAGRDYVGMFEPFVIDAIVHCGRQDFTTEELRSEVRARHELTLPIPALSVLLTRVTRNGFVRREAGRFFLIPGHPLVADIRTEREKIEQHQRVLARAFREAAQRNGVVIASDEDALELILGFLERYHVSLALRAGHPDVTDPSEDTQRSREVRATAVFLAEAATAGNELSLILQEMLEGFILQNTLLLKDISTAARRFRSLHVYCDSGLLFGALGYRGVATERATRELLQLLRETGATLNVFTTTIREMRRILDVYEGKIGTSEGRLSLYPTDLTRFFLAQGFAPSDIRIQNALIEKNLSSFGVVLRELPRHSATTTLDEAELARALTARRSGESDARVTHDVECIAGVLTSRAGRTSDFLGDIGSIFVSTSALTVRTTAAWYATQGGLGVPPMIHYLYLSNLAWLKRPTSAAKLKLHELVALCVAALRPSRATWDTFVRNLRTLQTSGQISSDETAAIVASGFTDRLLVDYELDEDGDSDTLSDVVERVKADYRKTADARVSEADARVEIAKQRASKAEVIASQANAASFAQRQRVNRFLRGVARAFSWIITAVIAAVLVAGAAASLYNAATGEQLQLAWLALVAIVAIAGVIGLLNGFNVKDARVVVEDRTAEFLSRRVFGADRVDRDS